MKSVICAIVKDESRYIREWVEWHINIGFDRIYIYEDYGSESHREILIDYINAGSVVVENLESSAYVKKNNPQLGYCTQWHLYVKFLKKAKDEKIDWVAFIDVDEFIVLDEGNTLRKLFADFNEYPAIHLAWLMYGANGHIERPNGGVLENYTTHMPQDFDFDNTHWMVKSLVNVAKCDSLCDVHRTNGGVNTDFTIDEEHLSFSKAHINHYFTKSWVDYCERMQRKGNHKNNDRHYDRFFMCNPELKDQENELLEHVRWNSRNLDTLWISKAHKIISGGNSRQLANLRKKLV